MSMQASENGYTSISFTLYLSRQECEQVENHREAMDVCSRQIWCKEGISNYPYQPWTQQDALKDLIREALNQHHITALDITISPIREIPKGIR